METKKDFFLDYSNMKIDRNAYPDAILNCEVDTLKTPIVLSNLKKTKKFSFKFVQEID